jgi:hypothetical protein
VSAVWGAPASPRQAVAPGRAAALLSLGATTAGYLLLYGLANHWTGSRNDIGRGVFAWEAAIPFVGWTIVPYLSICVFFVLSFFVDGDRRELQRHVARLAWVLIGSVVCYVLVPLQFTFVRPATHGLIGMLFQLLSSLDLPYNRAPSLHIGVLVVLWVRLVPTVTGWQRLALRGWFVLIAVSVLTTYQHHVLDIPAGAAMGTLVLVLTSRDRPHRWRRSCGSSGDDLQLITLERPRTISPRPVQMPPGPSQSH